MMKQIRKTRVVIGIMACMIFGCIGMWACQDKNNDEYDNYEFENLSVVYTGDIEELENVDIDDLKVYYCGQKSNEATRVDDIEWLAKDYEEDNIVYEKGGYEIKEEVPECVMKGIQNQVFMKQIKNYLKDNKKNESYQIENVKVVYGTELVDEELLIVPMIEAQLISQEEENNMDIIYSIYSAEVYD